MGKLNPLIHSQLRLSIMSLLMSVEEAQFTFLLEKTGVAAGNLSIQLSTLEEAGYVQTWKDKLGKRSVTKAKLTAAGQQAFQAYLDDLKNLLDL